MLKKIKSDFVIAPLSLVKWARGVRRTSKAQLGRIFRVGYYSRQDGLDVIWLVNDKGEYEQTVDRRFLIANFDILSFSDETDFYGDRRKKIERDSQR